MCSHGCFYCEVNSKLILLSKTLILYGYECHICLKYRIWLVYCTQHWSLFFFFIGREGWGLFEKRGRLFQILSLRRGAWFLKRAPVLKLGANSSIYIKHKKNGTWSLLCLFLSCSSPRLPFNWLCLCAVKISLNSIFLITFKGRKTPATYCICRKALQGRQWRTGEV